MTLIRVQQAACRANMRMPTELANAGLPLAAWSTLCSKIAEAESNACCYACAGEWCFCIVTGIFCIFFCHSCFTESLSRGNIDTNVRNINRDYFNGRPVVTTDASNRSFMFNTDMIQAPQLLQQPMMSQQPKFAEAAYASQPVYAAQPANNAPVMATLVSIPPQARSMQVRIPEGATAGSVLTVMSPEEIQVQVSVPPNTAPGSEITIQY